MRATVAAVVVTRDRRELLRNSLEALRGQSRPIDRLVVVDNASSDGTAEMLLEEAPHARVIELSVNAGGAGGYHEGMKAAMAEGADWLWLLDDDTFARPDALARLMQVVEHEPGLNASVLASRVEWTDGQPHPMNVPTVRRRDPEQLAEAVRRGLLPLRASTFVSLLVSRSAVQEAGLPHRGYFWQADDIEYTARILRRDHGFFVPTSVVEHRTPLKWAPAADARRCYFSVRNSIFMLRGDAWETREKPALAWAVLRSVGQFLRANRFSAASLRTLARALRDGVTASP